MSFIEVKATFGGYSFETSGPFHEGDRIFRRLQGGDALLEFDKKGILVRTEAKTYYTPDTTLLLGSRFPLRRRLLTEITKGESKTLSKVILPVAPWMPYDMKEMEDIYEVVKSVYSRGLQELGLHPERIPFGERAVGMALEVLFVD